MADPSAPHPVPLREAVRVWAKIGLLSFGGPAGQIALMHREFVLERRWLDEARFLHALNYCMLLPGPEAMQLATYVGWLLHRTLGGVLAGLLFILPGLCAVIGLSLLYATGADLPAVAGLMFGLKAAVLAVVVQAMWRVGKRALTTRLAIGIAVAAFASLFALAAPFPLVILGAAAIGLIAHRAGWSPPPRPAAAAVQPSVVDQLEAQGLLAHTRPSVRAAARTLAVCLALWSLPFIAIALLVGTASVFWTQAGLFSHTAVVTFGGAYAVLAYLAQRAVETYGWLSPREMVDGLGLAETTPGPLILVIEFVAFFGAMRNPGDLPPLLAGVIGALVTAWVTFVPCFLWILVGAPYIEALRGNRTLSAALAAITAAVVGVIANLSLWFAWHVLFTSATSIELGPLHAQVPVLSTLDPWALAIAATAFGLLFMTKLKLPWVLLVCIGLGLTATALRG